jgi:hypothetical protein
VRTCMASLLPLFCLSLEGRPPPGLSEAVNAYEATMTKYVSASVACSRFQSFHIRVMLGARTNIARGRRSMSAARRLPPYVWTKDRRVPQMG